MNFIRSEFKIRYSVYLNLWILLGFLPGEPVSDIVTEAGASDHRGVGVGVGGGESARERVIFRRRPSSRVRRCLRDRRISIN